MKEISGFPYFEVQFDKEGAVYDEEEVRHVVAFVSGATKIVVSDLFVFSHGWNNDMDEARDLYRRFFARVRQEIDENPPPTMGARSFAVLAILWPSKKFADDDLTASGAASVVADGEEAEILRQLENLKGAFDNPNEDAIIEQAKKLVPVLDDDPNAPADFANLIRSLPDKHEQHRDDASDLFFKMSPDELVKTLSSPDLLPPPSGEMGGAADFNSSTGISDGGGAAGLDIFGGLKAAARKVLNFATYYQMKARAGDIGRNGVYRVIREIREKAPGVKIHLIGHSFGGRLVTAVADGSPGMPSINPDSMTLIQSAFSHYGFAQKFDGQRDGFFRQVVTQKKVAGPIIITHSIKDEAVGIAYPIASKLSGDDAASAAAFGDEGSRFGGIGRNGAQKTPEADNTTPLGAVTFPYSFKAGKLYNLNADTIILGHSDIDKREVAHALLCAIAST